MLTADLAPTLTTETTDEALIAAARKHNRSMERHIRLGHRGVLQPRRNPLPAVQAATSACRRPMGVGPEGGRDLGDDRPQRQEVRPGLRVRRSGPLQEQERCPAEAWHHRRSGQRREEDRRQEGDRRQEVRRRPALWRQQRSPGRRRSGGERHPTGRRAEGC